MERDEKQNPIIYHYTDSKGLMGIIREKCMWATDLRYLNDASEFSYTIDLITEAIDRLRKSKELDYKNGIYHLEQWFSNHKKDPYNKNKFVCSFSEIGDLLSQWRGYCPSTGGFSIGFDSNALIKNVSKKGWSLITCGYNQEVQIDLVQTCVAEFEKEFDLITKSKGPDNEIDFKVVGKHLYRFWKLATSSKHPSFSEEKEKRLIYDMSFFPGKMEKINEQIKFRSKNSFLIPYCEVDLTNENGMLPIKEIIVGPTPHQELSIQSLEQFLKLNGILECKIKCSNIPYREM